MTTAWVCWMWKGEKPKLIHISTEIRADLKVGEYEVKLGTLSLRGG